MTLCLRVAAVITRPGKTRRPDESTARVIEAAEARVPLD